MGKQALNFDRETVESDLVRADEKRVKNLDARGPGVRGIGGNGGGERESRAGAGIFSSPRGELRVYEGSVFCACVLRSLMWFILF